MQWLPQIGERAACDMPSAWWPSRQNGAGANEEMPPRAGAHVRDPQPTDTCLRARGEIQQAGRVAMLKLGEFTLVAVDAFHGESGAAPDMFLQWIFPREHGFWQFTEAAPLRVFGESAKLGLRVTGATAGSMRRRFEQFLAAAGIARLAIFFQILAELANAPSDEVESSVNDQLVQQENGMHQSAICRAVAHICTSHGDGVRMSEMLRLTNMSRASFARQFRRCTGTSFSSFRNRVRLEAVCRELRETVEPVGTIAFGHGFNQLSFFNRLFRRELGMSPTEYRHQYRAAKASETYAHQTN